MNKKDENFTVRLPYELNFINIDAKPMLDRFLSVKATSNLKGLGNIPRDFENADKWRECIINNMIYADSLSHIYSNHVLLVVTKLYGEGFIFNGIQDASIFIKVTAKDIDGVSSQAKFREYWKNHDETYIKETSRPFQIENMNMVCIGTTPSYESEKAWPEELKDVKLSQKMSYNDCLNLLLNLDKNKKILGYIMKPAPNLFDDE